MDYKGEQQLECQLLFQLGLRMNNLLSQNQNSSYKWLLQQVLMLKVLNMIHLLIQIDFSQAHMFECMFGSHLAFAQKNKQANKMYLTMSLIDNMKLLMSQSHFDWIYMLQVESKNSSHNKYLNLTKSLMEYYWLLFLCIFLYDQSIIYSPQVFNISHKFLSSLRIVACDLGICQLGQTFNNMYIRQVLLNNFSYVGQFREIQSLNCSIHSFRSYEIIHCAIIHC